MMVCTRARTVEIPSTPKRETMALTGATPPQSCRLSIDKEGKMEMSLDYEKCREQRIRENMERMQKMGIMDLALKFKSSVSRSAPAFKKSPSQRSTPSPLQSSKDLPRRRSSRFNVLYFRVWELGLMLFCYLDCRIRLQSATRKGRRRRNRGVHRKGIFSGTKGEQQRRYTAMNT